MRDFSYSKARTRDFTAKRVQDSGGVGVGAYIWMSFVVYR